MMDILPFVGTLAAIAVAFVHHPHVIDFVLLFVLWLATGLGLTVGYHRLFSHRSFATTPAIATLLLILGSMAGRGPMISWAAMHRRHHELSDQEGDLHSPNLGDGRSWGMLLGWLHAHLIWMIRHPYPNVGHYVPDLMRNLSIVRLNRRYYLWVVLGLAIPTVIGGLWSQSLFGALTGLLWGGFVRLFIVEQSMSAVNSFLHLFGSRPFHTAHDNSRNNTLLGVLVWGEGWHNNHHAFPFSATFGLAWYQFDPGFLLIRSLEWCGLAWDVKRPSPQKIAAKASSVFRQP